MTREELKAHCQRQIEGCEMWARHNGEEPHGKVYEEHKLILELLEQEPRWIPVSEKLPEEYNTVIASTDIGVVYPEARYSKEYGWEWAYESGMDYWEETESNVLAWMPLPEPFKAESEEEK